MAGETGTIEAAGRDVDGYGEVAPPGAELVQVRERRPHHPIGQFVDQVGLLGQRYEPVRVQQPERRVLPTDQSLDGLHLPAVRRRLRLVVQDQLATVDRPAQRGDQSEVGGVIMVGAGLVADYRGVLRLGHVHGYVCVLQQLFDVGTVIGGDDETDARLDRQRKAAHLHLVLDNVVQAV